MKLMVSLLLFLSFFSSAETLNDKVARNAANCLVGHAALKTEDYLTKQTDKYIELIEEIQGKSKGADTMKASIHNLKIAIDTLGSTKNEEANFLINKFCPPIDKIVSSRK